MGDAKFKAKTITLVGISGDQAVITGTGEDGRAFTLYVEDNGSGSTDIFRLVIAGIQQTDDGRLGHGDIRISPTGDDEDDSEHAGDR